MSLPVSSAPTSSRSLRSAFADAPLWALASLGVLIAGVVLRLFFYFDRRSLWLDEVWIALNIIGRSFLGLARPLDFSQSAPIGFLWMERIAVVLGGVNELALRAFPLVAGVLLLIALWMLARRMLDVRAAVLCLAFAALSPLLVYYSQEVKPYISDALVTVLVTWLTLDVLDDPDSVPAWRALVIGGVVALLVSTPSIFVLGATGLALIVNPSIRGRSGWRRIIGTGAVWTFIFTIGYVALYHDTASSDYMQRIWRDAFLSFPLKNLVIDARDAARMMWTESLFADTEEVLPRKALTAVALFSVIGLVALVRRYSVSVAVLLLGPFIFVAIASLARLWPMTPRLLLFVVPTLILLFVAGLVAVTSFLPLRVRTLALMALGGLFLIPAARFNKWTMAEPRRRDDVAPLIKEFSSLRGDDAMMYVMGHGAVSWVYYTAKWKDQSGPVFQYAMTRANVASHFAKRGCLQQEPKLRAVFGGMGDDVLSDSSLVIEAKWIAQQPEREVWLLNISYEREAGSRMDAQLLAQGAMRTLDRSRNGANLRRYAFPADSVPQPGGC